MIKDIEAAVHDIRKSKPVILNLTNYVTMDFIANSLLALGASPIMSVCKSELEELVLMCSAINLNIGTLDSDFLKKCDFIADIANKYNKPIVLDPVGSGATKIRTRISKTLLNKVSIVCGNASEIIALAGVKNSTRGVDSVSTVEEAEDIATELAYTNQCTVVVSGAVDFITDGVTQAHIPFGSRIMPLVTGMGCTLTAIIAAFRAVVKHSFKGSLIGANYVSLCGEMTAKTFSHPGSFRTHFIDNLYAADFDYMADSYNKCITFTKS